jgi:hypothetical protein
VTIELGDGLQFDEVLQIAKWLDVRKLLAPELRDELTTGVNSMLAITASLQQIPWLLGLIPGNIGSQIDGAVKALRLVQGLLEA